MKSWKTMVDPAFYPKEGMISRRQAAPYNTHLASKTLLEVIGKDRRYGLCLLGGLSVAALACSCFAGSAFRGGWAAVGLVAVFAVGIGSYLTAWCAAFKDSRVGRSRVKDHTLAVLLALGLLLIPALVHGATGDRVIHVAVVLSLVMIIGGAIAAVRVLVLILMVAGFGFLLTHILNPPTGMDGGLVFGIGIFVASAILWFGKSSEGDRLPLAFLTQLAVTVPFLSMVRGNPISWGVIPAAIVGAALGAKLFNPHMITSLWAPAMAVILVHLGGAFMVSPMTRQDLVIQLGAATLEFVLFVGVMARFMGTRPFVLPPGTYLSNPQCVVPRFDRGRDYALESDVN